MCIRDRLSAIFYTAARLPARSPGTLLLAGGLLLWPYHAEILMLSLIHI